MIRYSFYLYIGIFMGLSAHILNGAYPTPTELAEIKERKKIEEARAKKENEPSISRARIQRASSNAYLEVPNSIQSLRNPIPSLAPARAQEETIVIPLNKQQNATHNQNYNPDQQANESIIEDSKDDKEHTNTSHLPGQANQNNGSKSPIHSHSGKRSQSLSQQNEAESIRKKAHEEAANKLKEAEARLLPVQTIKRKFIERLMYATPVKLAKELKKANETFDTFMKKMFLEEYDLMIKRHPNLVQPKEGQEPIKTADQLWEEISTETEETRIMKDCYKCCKGCSVQ